MINMNKVDPFEMSECRINCSEEEYVKCLAEATEDCDYYNKVKPYSDEDYEDAKKQGLDLDDWNDYKKYCHMEEYADDEQDWWRS